MHLRPGIPLLSDVEQLTGTDLYREHTASNRAFLEKHGPALAGYGRHWGQDPFRLWSRRWEYPWVAERLLAFGRSQPRPVTILDAGSGVTYFDYYLCDRLPEAQVVCVDYDESYPAMFDAINRQTAHARVSFQQAALQSLPQEDGAIDAVACISVLEHTDNYDQIIQEFSRVLRPGGALVLTFDLSLDGKFTLARPVAEKLLASVRSRFDPAEPVDWSRELAGMDEARDAILTTDAVRRTSPELLPWRFPLLKGLHDLVKGHGWTGGFRSKSVFCLDARKR